MKKYIPRLKEKYIDKVIPKLKDDLGKILIIKMSSRRLFINS